MKKLIYFFSLLFLLTTFACNNPSNNNNNQMDQPIDSLDSIDSAKLDSTMVEQPINPID